MLAPPCPAGTFQGEPVLKILSHDVSIGLFVYSRPPPGYSPAVACAAPRRIRPGSQERNVLGEPQVNVTDRLAGLVQEQHSVRSSLLNHVRVSVVAVRPRAGVFVVGVRNQACEVGLLVARGGIVESEEAEGETSGRDVETSLSEQLVCCLSCVRERRLCGFVWA
jgi:hypothetical protein